MKRIYFLTALSVTSLVYGGTFYPHGVWDRDEVRVCFAEAENEKRELDIYKVKVNAWSDKNKQLVQTWIGEEFRADRTGIFFTGFKNCADSADYDVPLFYGKGNSILRFFVGGTDGFAILGSSLLANQLTDYPLAKSYAWFNSSGFSKATVVHEFGHIARLQHEHERIEAKTDPLCKNEKVGKIGGGTPATHFSHGDYDAESVMSYCAIHKKNGSKKGLSSGDVATLKEIYKNK